MSRCVTRLAEDLVAAGRSALEREHGAARVARALSERPSSARAVFAVGKAAAAMATGVLDVLGDQIEHGLVVSKAPATVPRMEVIVAGHPRPDERSVRATEAALAFVSRVPAGEELLVLISGGTSALLGGPLPGMRVEDFAAQIDLIMRAGADIAMLNRTRRRCGAALGGRLAAATRAKLRALIISDVLDDDPRIIGSGPLHGDAIGDAGVDTQIIAGPRDLQDSAVDALRALGYDVIPSDALVAMGVGELVDELAARRLEPGQCYLAVGEPTLKIVGDGIGGRAQHVALLMAERIAGSDRAVLALASDGSDGPTDAAGAIVTGETWRSDLAAAIDAQNSGPALDALGCLLRTGPTGTNLTDLYVVARAK